MRSISYAVKSGSNAARVCMVLMAVSGIFGASVHAGESEVGIISGSLPPARSNGDPYEKVYQNVTIDPLSSVDTLIYYLRSGDVAIREAAVSRLVQIGGPQVAERLKSALLDQAPTVRAAAVAALSVSPTLADVPSLLDLVRKESQSSTAEFGHADSTPTGDGVVAREPFDRVARSNAEMQLHTIAIAERAIISASKTRSAGTLIRALGDENPTVRRVAARALAEVESTGSQSLLIKMAERGDPAVVAGAYPLLIRLGLDAHEPILISSLQDSGTPAMAGAFLDSGNPRLAEAARAWAEIHGFSGAVASGRQGTAWGDFDPR